MRTPILAVLLVVAATAAADVHKPPDVVVRETVQSLAALVSDCRLPLAADPQALRGVVDKYLRPKADVLYAGQLILGRYWADADADQRRRFAEALYGTLVSRYATGLLVLTAGSVVVVPPAEKAGNDGHAAVEVRVQAGLATPVPAQLQMRQGSARWRAYDARWEGQSYVLSLRQLFAEQIRRDGLDTVIRRLEASAGSPVSAPEERPTAAGRCLRARAEG
ncbi:MAG TPA: ABC transporter substrate-binding protein [Gammaproteobacteria bacterium]|nr:ABC transporter substrate-binding protein [Gammaproteobacteria bacterium]